MGNFANNAVTDGGRLLLADLQAGAVFIPTKIVIGSGMIPSGKTAATMTEVAVPVKELAINKKKKTADGKVTIGGAYDNRDVAVAWYFRELALFARAEYREADGTVIKSVDEVLYSYGNAGDTADYMPAYYTDAVVERQIDLVSWVGQDTEIELTIEPGVQVTQEQKGQPGGIVGLDDDGNVNMGGGTINMEGGTVSGLTDPVYDGDAVPKSYVDEVADRVETKAGAPFNYANNSDLTNPVNSQRQASYAVSGETIDNWFAEDAELAVSVADGCVTIHNTGAENSYFAQKDIARELEYGKTYTCVAWFADGSKTIQPVKTQEGINIYSGIVENGIQFALADIGTYRIIVYVSPGATVNIKHIAVYEGLYTADNLPKYQPKGYGVEKLNCDKLSIAELLWENASPNSSFEYQSLTIESIKEYQFLLIMCKCDASDDMGETKDTYFTGLIMTQFPYKQILSGKKYQMYKTFSRAVIVEDSTITFYSGSYLSISSGTDGYCIEQTYSYSAVPYRIYGLKAR